jgi:hypothetical protein
LIAVVQARLAAASPADPGLASCARPVRRNLSCSRGEEDGAGQACVGDLVAEGELDAGDEAALAEAAHR